MPLHEKQATKSKYISWSSSKLKTCALKDIIKKVERQHTQTWRKYLQTMYLIRDLCLEYKKKSYNSTIKSKQPNLSMVKGF